MLPDPTKNVLDLVAAAIKRQDDLRELTAAHAAEVAAIRERHTEALRGEVNARASILAVQVTATAEAASKALVAALAPLQADIADLRRSQYQAQGRKTEVVEAVATTRADAASNRESNSLLVAALALFFSVLLGVVGVILTLTLK